MRRPCKPDRGEKKGKKKGRVEGEKKKQGRRKVLTGFLIVGPTLLLPHSNKKNKYLLINASHATSSHSDNEFTIKNMQKERGRGDDNDRINQAK